MSSPDSVDALAKRVADLEAFVARFGFRPGTEQPMPPAAQAAVRPPPLPPRVPPVVHAPPPPVRAEPVLLAERLTPPPVAAAIPYAVPQPSPIRPAPTHTGVEQAIGLKLAGWIGALIVAIGAAMGVKFAYDQGWLGNVPGEVKLGMLYAAALAIIGLGEWAYRRVSPLAAVGLYAAGIASLFVVGYAGSAYFHLYGEVPAFGLMAGACAIGAMISLRGGLASIAVLSHLGANIAPLILHDRTSGELPMLVYLLALQLMAVGLAHVGKGGRWWTLRTLALLTTSFWMATRLATPATAHSNATILFAAVYALIFQIELVLFVRRAQPESTGRSFSAPTFSLAVTGFFVGALLSWTSHYPPLSRGAHLLGLAMLLSVAAAATLASATAPAIRSLATSWLTQAALLVFVAIPVSLDGPAITFAWGGLAVAYGVVGFSLRRTRTVMAGNAVWVVAALHLLATTLGASQDDPLRAAWLTLNGVELPAFLLIALALGGAGHLLALLGGAKRMPDNGGLNGMAILGTVVWAVALIAGLPSLYATIGLLAAGWILAVIHFASGRSIYAGIAAGVVTLALAKWAAVDVLGSRFDSGVDADRRVVLNLTMAIGAAGAVSLVAMLRLMRGSIAGGGNPALTWTAILLSIIALTTGLSIEVERGAAHAVANGSPWPVYQLMMLGLTILWLVAVRAPVLVGSFVDPSEQRLRIAQQGADVLTVLLALKFLVLDAIAGRLSADRVAVTPALNLLVLVGLGVMIALWRSIGAKGERSPLTPVVLALLFATPLVIGSIELDRAFGPSRTLIAWSVFWSIYAVGSIVLGFWQRSAPLRFAGLGLLAVTLLKIVFVDLAAAPTGWRIVSFLAVGAVLLLTSVIYGKLSPKAEPS